MVRTPIVPAIVVVAALALGACTAGQASSPTPDITPSPTEAPTDAPTEPEEPTDSLGEFTCDYPIVEAASVPAVTNILDVRIGTHEGYDRVVFEFSDGTPQLTLDRAQPPFLQDGSGFEVEVEGSAFLQLIMRGGTKQTDTGASSYPGPTEFAAGFPQLVQLVEIGDFEAQSTWVLGLEADGCARVSLLDGNRLVIDLEHGG